MAEHKAPKMVIDQAAVEDVAAPAAPVDAPDVAEVAQAQGDVARDAEPTPVSVAPTEAAHEHDAPAAEASALGAMRSLPGWVKRTFPGHERAVYGALLGLVLALLIFAIGIGRALVIALFVAIGALIGQCLDGDTRIVNALRKLFSDGNN